MSLLLPEAGHPSVGVNAIDLTRMGPAADSKPAKRNRPGACSFGQRPFENSICLIAIGSDCFEEAVDHKIVFKRHAQFTSDPAFDHCFFYHAEHEHLGNAGAAIFFNYAESDQATLSDALLAKQQFDQTNWKTKVCQPTVEIAQDRFNKGGRRGQI